MNSLYFLLDAILRLYFWVVILAAIFSWLVGLGIVNRSNQIVAMFYEAVWNLTNPVLSYIRSYIRRYLPNLGGIDISPIIVLLAIQFLRSLLAEYWPLTF